MLTKNAMEILEFVSSVYACHIGFVVSVVRIGFIKILCVYTVLKS